MEPDLINEIIPGDEQYQQGIAPLVNQPLFVPQEGGNNFPIKEVATTTAKNLAKNYVLKKMGIDGIAGNVIGSLGLASLNPFALMTMGSFLPNPVKGIAGYLRNKRAEKEYARNERMLESNILSQELARQAAAMQDTPQGRRDQAMGGGSIPTKSAPAKSISVGNPYGGGAGGIHSGYK